MRNLSGEESPSSRRRRLGTPILSKSGAAGRRCSLTSMTTTPTLTSILATRAITILFRDSTRGPPRSPYRMILLSNDFMRRRYLQECLISPSDTRTDILTGRRPKSPLLSPQTISTAGRRPRSAGRGSGARTTGGFWNHVSGITPAQEAWLLPSTRGLQRGALAITFWHNF